MHIVIPMSGIGKRFIDAGYKDPKPLIEVEGKPIIGHVVDMFPGESKFTFICNGDHLANTPMREILQGLRPDGNIVSIPPHKKGPVYAVSHVYDLIKNDEEVIVNYCDFGKVWDYPAFLTDTRSRKADGAIAAYRGFHPHMLGSTNYAFMREEDRWMLEIKEKEPFTDNRMQEFASDGTYYFRTGEILKEYFNRTMERSDLELKGEYYVSVVYNLLVEAGLKVSIFEIDHMLQWGTPGDLEEYNLWSGIFKSLAENPYPRENPKRHINLIPMAGRGSRFSDRGYTTPKPLLPVDGRPMVVRAMDSLPAATRNVFVAQKEHEDQFGLTTEIQKYDPRAVIKTINGVTEGQAITVDLGLEDEDLSLPLLVAASDNAMIYDRTKLAAWMSDSSVDAIVFTFRNHPSAKRNPEMYGWVPRNGENATGVSVKKAISDQPGNDDAIVGAFYFRSGQLYKDTLKKLVDSNIRVNQEFYIDSMVGVLTDSGSTVKILPVEQYICWGTPDDYETYRYWQRCFSRVDWHPYEGDL